MSEPGSEPLDLDEHLRAIVAGDADAFARWVARAEPSLRLSLRGLAAHVDVEAVVQEALLRVWQAAPRFVPDGRPNGLLRLGVRIAHNLAVSERRRLRASAVPEDMIERLLEEAGEVAVEPAPDPILRRRIEECRDKLPERPSQALGGRLSCAGGEPDESIAARLGMRLNTFLQNFTRARRLLAECLEAHGLRLEDLVR
jgi:RNA polymerase sigma-70 factor (ECF subfamily)